MISSMRRLICLGAFMSFILACAVAAETPSSNAAANKLFAAAVQDYNQAIKMEGQGRITALSGVLANLDRIAADYPQSLPGQRILAGGKLGPVDLSALRAEVAGKTTPAVPAALTRLPKASLVLDRSTRFAPAIAEQDWVTRILPGGKLTGYHHGQFPSVGAKTHAGVDLSGPTCGAPVLAPLTGKVMLTLGPDDPNYVELGNLVIIDHGQSGGQPTYTLYMNLQAASVAVDQVVQMDQQIGTLGDTGDAAQCQLHFEVRHFPELFFPLWHRIYGAGVWADEPEFRIAWTDPAMFMNSQSNGMSDHFAADCAATVDGGSVPFPVEQPDSAVGEGASDAAIMQTNAAVTLWGAPGGIEVPIRPARGKPWPCFRSRCFRFLERPRSCTAAPQGW